MKTIIFTDLDGTLLDHETYSFEAAKPALELIKEKGLPMIICTSKTRAEIEKYRKLLDNRHPFISENGGAIFIPKEYFSHHFEHQAEDENYRVIKLGEDYPVLRRAIEAIRQKGIPLRSFGDMTVEELMQDSGLDREEAELAKNREFDEVFSADDKYIGDIRKLILQKGLNFTKGGRYCHIMGNSDKGKAVNILSGLYRKQSGDIRTIGLGDSSNDFPMLDNVDKPYLVIRPDGSYSSGKYIKAEGIGPIGWNKTVLKELGR